MLLSSCWLDESFWENQPLQSLEEISGLTSMNTMSFSRKRWLWWLSLLVRLLLLPTSWTTQALQERALQPHVVYRKHSTTIRHPLRMSMQEKGTIGATIAYEDDQSGTSVRCQNTRETGQESGVVKEQQRSSTRAVDLKFTSTLLTHYENKLVYTLNDGTSLTLRRLQYLVYEVPFPYLNSFDSSHNVYTSI